MTKEKTLQDWQKTVETLADSPELSNLINLQKTLVTIAHEELGLGERYPFAIVADKNEVGTFDFSRCRCKKL